MRLIASANPVQSGATLTLTATIVGWSKTIAPTGTITFGSTTTTNLGATVSYSTVTDPNGNLDLQGVISFIPIGSDTYNASYSGDQNYSASGPLYIGAIGVAGNDITLSDSPSSISVAPGQSGQVTLVIGMQTNTSVVSFGANPCTGLPNESSCSPGGNQISSTTPLALNVYSTAPHLAAARRLNSGPMLAITMPFAAILLVRPLRRRTLRWLAAAISLLLVIGIISCGGGGSTQPPPPRDPGTPKGSYKITVTAASGSGSTAITHTTTFTLVVQ